MKRVQFDQVDNSTLKVAVDINHLTDVELSVKFMADMISYGFRIQLVDQEADGRWSFVLAAPKGGSHGN